MKKQSLIKNHDTIKMILAHMEVHDYTINSDNTIDVKGDICLNYSDLSKAFPLVFRHVTGNFTASHSSIINCNVFPEYVGGHINIKHNDIADISFFTDFITQGPLSHEHGEGQLLAMGRHNKNPVKGLEAFYNSSEILVIPFEELRKIALHLSLEKVLTEKKTVERKVKL